MVGSIEKEGPKTGGIDSKSMIPAVNRLFSDIAKYNSNFSVESVFTSSLDALLGMVDKDVPENSNPLSDKKEDQRAMASALVIMHSETLDRIGLALEQVSGKTAVLIGFGENIGDGQLRINVSDKNKFLSFLEGLEPKQIEDTGLKPNLETLPGILAQQIRDNYDLKEPNDYALQLLSGFGLIIEQYKRLGMADSVSELEVYLGHAKQGDLREYVAIERNSLLSKPREAFGPADWQRDSTPEYLEKRWTRALKLLSETEANPKAQELHRQLAEHLLDCVKIAIADMQSMPRRNPEDVIKMRQKSEILEEVYSKLNKDA